MGTRSRSTSLPTRRRARVAATREILVRANLTDGNERRAGSAGVRTDGPFGAERRRPLALAALALQTLVARRTAGQRPVEVAHYRGAVRSGECLPRSCSCRKHDTGHGESSPSDAERERERLDLRWSIARGKLRSE